MRISNFSQKLLASRRSLLFPMLVVAFGIHAVLLAVPIPSTEEQKEPDSKKNPITVTQIPTEKPTPAKASTQIPKVAIPAVASTKASTSITRETNPVNSSPIAEDTLEQQAPVSPTTPELPAKEVAPRSSPTRFPNANEVVDNSNEQTPQLSSQENASLDPALTIQDQAQETDDTLWARFPHFQPSEKDCYNLGFGENCRIVENGAIAQIVEFFQTELPAHDYTAQLITNEPTRKVFKVMKADKTVFLNIWQSKEQVSYLLAGVIYEQSPEEISRNVKRSDQI